MSEVRPEWYQLRDLLEAGEFSAAEDLLEKAPRLLFERNAVGETVLHFLAVEDNRPAVEWLHARGSDLNTTNKFGTPLIFEIALLGYKELLLWFVAKGANMQQRNGEGQTIKDYLIEFEKFEMIAFLESQRVC